MSISEQIRACTLCPLSKKLDAGFLPVPGIGSPKSSIMMVYDFLTQSDYLIQQPITSKEGLFLDKILGKAGLSREEMYITPLVKCFGSTKEHIANVKNCYAWFVKQRYALKPRVLIVSGSQSIYKVFGKNSSNISVKEIVKTTIIQGDTLVIPLPTLFVLMNAGNTIVDYHIDRLRKAKTWVSKVPNS